MIAEGFSVERLGFADAALAAEHELIDVVLVDAVANTARRSAQDRCQTPPAKFL